MGNLLVSEIIKSISVIDIPRRKQKIKYSRKQACKYLEPKGDISNSLQPLCYCSQRDLVLGTKAFVCETCNFYSPKNNVKIMEIYEESKKLAEDKLKEKQIELLDLLSDEDVDLSTDEFEEDEGELPLKFEKRKADKDDLEDSDDFSEIICPFCDEIVDDLRSHIESCEFAPDDASVEDIMPLKTKKKKEKKTASPSKKSKETEEEEGSQKCPYCGKEFQRLGRHLNFCKKKPVDNDEEEEDEEDDEEEDDEEDDNEEFDDED